MYMLSLQERIACFYIEWLQGKDTQWLLNKYDFGGFMQVGEDHQIVSSSPEGHRILNMLSNVPPQDVVRARIRQKEYAGEFPWINFNVENTECTQRGKQKKNGAHLR